MSRYNGFRRMGRYAGLLCGLAFSFGVMMSCSRELTPEDALIAISEQPEFQVPYYAPIRVGEQVLTGDNHKNCEEYIRKHYGSLIDAGLLDVKQSDRNTWRTVIDVQLTLKGLAMSDTRRATEDEAFVQVCRMVPVRIDEFRTVTEKKVIECTYVFEERDITPFGEYKGFQQGRTYKDRRTFVRARGSWHVQ